MSLIASAKRYLEEMSASPVMRQSGLIVANNFVLAATGYLYFLVLGRRFATSVVGESAAVLGIATIVALIARLGADASLFHYLPASSARARLLARLFLFTEGAALLAGGVALLLLRNSPPLNGRVEPGILLVILGLVTCFTNVLDFGLMAIRRTEWMLVRNLVAGGLKVVLPVVLIALGQPATLETLLVSLVLSALIGLVVGAPLLARSIRERAPGHEPIPPIRELAGYASSNHVASIFQALPALVLPLLLIITTTADNSAYFYVASNLSGIVLVLPYALSQATFIHLSHKRAGASSSHEDAGVRRQMLISIASAIAFTAVAPILLLLLGKAYFANSLAIAVLMGFSTPAVLLTNLFVVELRSRSLHVELVAYTALFAAMQLVGTLVGARFLSGWGIGVGWLVASIIIALIATMGRRRLDRRPPESVHVADSSG